MTEQRKYACCRWLRSRALFIDPDERLGYMSEGDDTEIFWCVKTQSPEGPDRKTCSPRLCQSSRACFERF